MDINIFDISFVIQGPILSETNENLNIIRKNFPNSTIILSTWETDFYNKIDLSNYNEVVLNKDPGFKPFPIGNLNRQIISTINGIARVKTKYVVKLRTDTIIYNSSFLNYYKNNISKYNVFENSILILSIYAKDPSKWQVLFHISDMFFFGLTNDLRNLFKIPLANDEFLTPEQYIFTRYLKMINRASISNMYELTFLKILKSELYISNSFIIVDYNQQNFLQVSVEKQRLFYLSIFKKPFYDLYNNKTLNKLKINKLYLFFRAIRIYILHFVNYKCKKIISLKIFKSIYKIFKN